MSNLDNMIPASDAQNYLADLSIEYIRSVLQQAGEPYDDLTVKTLYLGNLCARGDEEKINAFIHETDIEELREVLNHGPDEQWNCTCLHMLLNWNKGDKAVTLFRLLVEHGAEYERDGYGYFPWQQLGTVWITPVEYVQLGDRNQDEFEQTCATLREMYSLENYENDNQE